MTATQTAPKAARPGISTSPVAKKLLIKPGHKIGAIGAPATFKETLGPLPDGATVSASLDAGTAGTSDPTATSTLDAVVAFVPNSAQLKDTLTRANAAVKPDGLLWLCYKKGGAKAGTDLNRDSLYQSVSALGYSGMGLIAFDDSWAAMRFKPQK